MFFSWLAGPAAFATVALPLYLYAPDKPRVELEAAYPGDYRTVEGVRLRLRDTGPRDAPAVILLHGFCASLDTWEPWAQALSAHYRVIRFDLPGFGLTGADPTGDYSDAREMKILTGLMDQLGVVTRNPCRQFHGRPDRLELCRPAPRTRQASGADLSGRTPQPGLRL